MSEKSQAGVVSPTPEQIRRHPDNDGTRAMNIRKAADSDFRHMWPIFKKVIASESSYVFAADTGYHDAFAYWFGPAISTFVAEDEGKIVAMYKIVQNQRDLGGHVCNASFMVQPSCSGKGIGRMLGLDCLREAKKAGYSAIQFNFVVSTNTAAVALWERLGFTIVGTLPKVFAHKALGLVDAYVMHRFLDDI
jgi:L-amino acid N-acyltransferase YncA